MLLPNPLSLYDKSFDYFKIDYITEDNLSFVSNNEDVIFKSSLSDICELEYQESLSNSITKEINRKDDKEKYPFKTEFLNNKRGKKPTNEKRIKIHTCLALDNILSKVQTHFLNFVVFLSNDVVNTFLHKKNKNFFKKFDRAKKLRISSKYFNNLKNSSIKDLMKDMGISDKYKKYDIDINKKNLEKLTKYSWFEKYFEMKFSDLFNYYYNNEQPLKEISINDITILLSQETKSFSYLLQKNEKLREDIIQATKRFYLDEKMTNLFD